MGDSGLFLVLLIFVARLMLFVAEAAPADVRDRLTHTALNWYRATLYVAGFLFVLAIAVVIYIRMQG